MASDFKSVQQARIHHLLSRLVTSVLEAEIGTDNHSLALAFCKHNLQNHQYEDTIPSKAEDQYNRLQEHLGEHAQLEKEKGLEVLRERFLHQQLGCDYPDPHHRILSMLYWLQGLPLQSKFSLDGLRAIERRASSIPGTEAGDLRQRQEVLEQLSDCSEEVDDYGADSDLSEWSQTDVEEDVDEVQSKPGNGEAENVSVIRNSLAVSDYPQCGGHQQLILGPKKMSLVQPHHVAAVYEDGCLMKAMSRSRAVEVKTILPQPEACTSEEDLMWEALRSLQGIPGKTLRFKKGAFLFEINPQAHMPDLSPAALSGVLDDFVVAGNQMIRLREFVGYASTHCLLAAVSVKPLTQKSRAPVTPTMSALSIQIEYFLEECCKAVGPLEAELDLQHRGLKSWRQHPLTLLKVRDKLEPVFKTLEILEAVLNTVVPTKWCSSAESSAAVLTQLHSTLEKYSCQANERAEAILLRLLLGAMEPYLNILQTWLFDGKLEDRWHEFFIDKPHSDSLQGLSWSETFQCRHVNGYIPLPGFLKKVMPGILAAGKAVHLMAHVEQVLEKESRLGYEGKHRRILAASVHAGNHSSTRPGLAAHLRSSPLLAGGGMYSTFISAVQDMVVIKPTVSPAWSAKQPQATSNLQVLLETIFPLLDTRTVGEHSEIKGPVHEDIRTTSAPDICETASQLSALTQGSQQDMSMILAGRHMAQLHKSAEALVSFPAFKGIEDLYVLGCDEAAVTLALSSSASLGRLDWLDGKTRIRLPPPAFLLEQCLLGPITRQVEISSMELLGQIMGPWGLMHELRVLRSFFLMGSPALEGFVDDILPRLIATPGVLRAIPSFELELALKEALPAGTPEDPIPEPEKLNVEISHEALKEEVMQLFREGEPCVDEIELLQFKYQVTPPLELVVTSEALDVYNRALVFLLKIRWTKHELDECSMRLFRRIRKERTKGAEADQDVLRILDDKSHFGRLQVMMHFVEHLHQYVMDRNLYVSWVELEQALDVAGSLDDVICAHNKFLLQIENNCLLKKRVGAWAGSAFLHKGVNNALSCILQWCKLLGHQANVEKVETSAARVAFINKTKQLKDSFENVFGYILRVMGQTFKSTGTTYGLEHLLMRLDFNSWRDENSYSSLESKLGSATGASGSFSSQLPHEDVVPSRSASTQPCPWARMR